MTRLDWHPETTLYAPQGVVVARPVVQPSDRVTLLGGADPAAVLAQALAHLAAGNEVRVIGKTVSDTGEKGHRRHIQCLTSGSSGTPKAIRRSQASWAASIAENARLFDLGPGDGYAVIGAPEHSLTLYAAAEAATLGADIHVLHGAGRHGLAAGLERCTILYATPAQLRLLAPAAPLMRMRLVMVGGGMLDAATARAAAAHFPAARLVSFYGASETSFITLNTDPLAHPDAGLSYPGVTLSLRDAAGAEVTEGEIWVRSPYLFRDYAEGTEPGTRWRDGFLCVGEIGRRDDAGRITVLGRASRMFTVADRNVYPEPIETWLMSQPGVTRAAVIPVPDRLRGSRAIAVVSGELETGQLLGQARERFGRDVIKTVHRLDDLPLLPAGKVDLHRLSEMLRCL